MDKWPDWKSEDYRATGQPNFQSTEPIACYVKDMNIHIIMNHVVNSYLINTYLHNIARESINKYKLVSAYYIPLFVYEQVIFDSGFQRDEFKQRVYIGWDNIDWDNLPIGTASTIIGENTIIIAWMVGYINAFINYKCCLRAFYNTEWHGMSNIACEFKKLP